MRMNVDHVAELCRSNFLTICNIRVSNFSLRNRVLGHRTSTPYSWSDSFYWNPIKRFCERIIFDLDYFNIVFIISSRSRSSVEELKIQNNLLFKNWILTGLTWHLSLKRESSRSQSKWINMTRKESSREEFTNSIRVLNRGLVWIFNSSIEECDVETKNEMSSIFD